MGTSMTSPKVRVLLLILLLPLFSLAQKLVTGHIISNSDQTAIPGASITLKGSKAGTSTAVDGSFSIKAKEGDVLIITGIGITRQEFTVGNNQDFTVSVIQNSKNLNEVVVTALGIKKEAKRL